MKSVMSVLLGMMLVSVTVLTYAGDPLKSGMIVVNQSEGVYKLIYQGEQQGSVRLNILDQGGRVLFTEKMKDVNGFSRLVNFKSVEPGEYTIVLTDAAGEQTKKVVYAQQTAPVSVEFVNVVKTAEEGKYLFSVKNASNENVYVRIYDGRHELVHEENRSIDGDLAIIYNTRKVVGEPSFEISSGKGLAKIVR